PLLLGSDTGKGQAQHTWSGVCSRTPRMEEAGGAPWPRKGPGGVWEHVCAADPWGLACCSKPITHRDIQHVEWLLKVPRGVKAKASGRGAALSLWIRGARSCQMCGVGVCLFP
ncbi:hypothetical protein H1C71_035861, partial [Ictidomys tridecemlineatus]